MLYYRLPERPPLQRALLALAIALGVHVGLVAVVLANAVWKGWQLSRTVDIELVSTKVEEVKQLPFGPPPAPPGDKTAGVRRPRPKVAGADEGMKLAAGDAGADAQPDGGVSGDARDAGDASPGADAHGPRNRDLRAYGPEGSRLTAILRLDRLRASPEAPATIAAVDGLLRHLPDRRRLLDGTGLDLYRDFDAILIATPNPLDDAVTFLAARHHLSDAELKAALERGAQTAGRPLTWRNEGGRPVGVRRARRRDGDAGVPYERDDRLLLLPRPGLAVMAPPAYAALLLPKGAGSASATEARWRELVARIDAEDGALPDDAILMMTAANLVGPRKPRGLQAPGGMALPVFATMLVGIAPGPYLEANGEFERAADARRWEEKWPTFKQQLLGSPLLLLSGFTGIVSRAEVSRDGPTLMLRTTAASQEEMRRVLRAIANLIPGGGMR